MAKRSFMVTMFVKNELAIMNIMFHLHDACRFLEEVDAQSIHVEPVVDVGCGDGCQCREGERSVDGKS
jgi:hypothetical protein